MEYFHFGRPNPKHTLVVLKSEKQGGEKKRSSPHFVTFPPSIFIFHLPFYNFSSLLLNFHPFSLFSLPLFFPVGQQKFSGQKSLGGTLPPAPLPVMPLPMVNEQHTLSLLPCPLQLILISFFSLFINFLFVNIRLLSPYSLFTVYFRMCLFQTFNFFFKVSEDNKNHSCTVTTLFLFW